MWCEVPTGVDEPDVVDGAATDLLVGAAKGPESTALLVDTILTAATRFLVLNTLWTFFVLLPVRTGGRGPDILTVVLIRAERPGKVNEAEVMSVLWLLWELLLMLLVLMLETPPAVSAAWARKLVTGMLGARVSKIGESCWSNKLALLELHSDR